VSALLLNFFICLIIIIKTADYKYTCPIISIPTFRFTKNKKMSSTATFSSLSIKYVYISGNLSNICILISTDGYASMMYSMWCHYSPANMNISMSVVEAMIIWVIEIMSLVWVVIEVVSVVKACMSVNVYEC
jgi:hypothetical protein